MASGYMIEESLGFCTEYFSLYTHTRRRVWDAEEEMRDAGEVLLGRGVPRRLSYEQTLHVHDYVLKHSVPTAELLSEWHKQREAFKNSWVRYRSTLRGRSGPFPDHLIEPLPKFSSWINNHVRILRDEGFPVSRELESLHCMPSEYVTSYQAMWAYGAHYVVSNKEGLGYVSFDSGIAAIPPGSDTNEIDVGILRDIILVSYSEVNCVILEGSWIKTMDEGRRVIKKDQYGFWTVHYRSWDASTKNPYVYPAAVSQKVVLHNDIRSRRVIGQVEEIQFGASGSTSVNDNGRPNSPTQNRTLNGTADVADEEIAGEDILNFAAQEEDVLDERHLDDTQFVDEVEIQYVE
ncbi:hypothetical protein KC19_VG229300 [Ceratodon purpureus]|uniref:Uncharacterized protein n=1 Tax=Ceratodon purpureus TaxID=3225 RepID=A0A8T0HSW5_CERPU|nr:hypothetical protein KC19_VG229300 [Ceratodon purpureus]